MDNVIDHGFLVGLGRKKDRKGRLGKIKGEENVGGFNETEE